jgi:hypothetical protein
MFSFVVVQMSLHFGRRLMCPSSSVPSFSSSSERASSFEGRLALGCKWVVLPSGFQIHFARCIYLLLYVSWGGVGRRAGGEWGPHSLTSHPAARSPPPPEGVGVTAVLCFPPLLCSSLLSWWLFATPAIHKVNKDKSQRTICGVLPKGGERARTEAARETTAQGKPGHPREGVRRRSGSQPGRCLGRSRAAGVGVAGGCIPGNTSK